MLNKAVLLKIFQMAFRRPKCFPCLSRNSFTGINQVHVLTSYPDCYSASSVLQLIWIFFKIHQWFQTSRYVPLKSKLVTSPPLASYCYVPLRASQKYQVSSGTELNTRVFSTFCIYLKPVVKASGLCKLLTIRLVGFPKII